VHSGFFGVFAVESVLQPQDARLSAQSRS